MTADEPSLVISVEAGPPYRPLDAAIDDKGSRLPLYECPHCQVAVTAPLRHEEWHTAAGPS